jgi:Family of unknown function (DUF6498)
LAQRKSFIFVFKDPEFWAILIFNIFILVAYYYDAASAKAVIILYYIQSVLIGIQTFLRLMAQGVIIPSKSKFSVRFGGALFFAFHYGMFHFVYFIFLFKLAFDLKGNFDWPMIRLATAFMIISALFSLVSDVRSDVKAAGKRVAFMFQPYLRIIPIHFFIILGFNMDGDDMTKAFALFIGLKTLGDLLMHVLVSGTHKKRRPKAIEGWI